MAKLTRITNTVEEHMRALRRDKHEFDQARGWAEEVAAQQQRVCMLDVGGEVFHCDRNVFLQRRDSLDNFLSVLTSGAFAPSDQDENGRYFLDRDPATFVHILNFMRGNDLDLLVRSATAENALTREAVFFGLHGLALFSGRRRVCVVTRHSMHVHDPTGRGSWPWVTYRITMPRNHRWRDDFHYYCGMDGRLRGVSKHMYYYPEKHMYYDTLYPISRVWVRQSIKPPTTWRCGETTRPIRMITSATGQFLVNIEFYYATLWATVCVLDLDNNKGGWRMLPRITDKYAPSRPRYEACVVNGRLLLYCWTTESKSRFWVQSCNLNAGVDDAGFVHASQMQYPRFSVCIVACQGAMLVIGGCPAGNPRATSGVVEAYNPASDTWSTLPALNHPRHSARAVVHDDGNGNVYVYVCGGSVNKIERIRPGVDVAWEVLPSPAPNPNLGQWCGGCFNDYCMCNIAFLNISVVCLPDAMLSR